LEVTSVKKLIAATKRINKIIKSKEPRTFN
jgi:hypothetical protein